MNGNVKFHKATSPAFNAGEVWVSCCGVRVEIISIRKYKTEGNHISDYGVTYKTDRLRNPELTHEKDCWNFQVRYTHQADLVV